MSSTFAVYLRLGFEHLLDLQGYDHILFLAVLCAPYSLRLWRELLILVTAFTVGHSVSLALATLALVRADSAWIEFLIPATIVATAAHNLVAAAGRPHIYSGSRLRASPESGGQRTGGVQPTVLRTARRTRYLAALAFGVIHGLGFSGFLRLVLGDERSLFVPLLSFNIGLELAQIVVAGGVLALALVATRGLGVPARAWTAIASLGAGLVAAWMTVERVPW